MIFIFFCKGEGLTSYIDIDLQKALKMNVQQCYKGWDEFKKV